MSIPWGVRAEAFGVPSEEEKRLQARLDDPLKLWELQASDYSARQLWPDYSEAYQKAMAATSSANAPWCVVPADSTRLKKWT